MALKVSGKARKVEKSGLVCSLLGMAKRLDSFVCVRNQLYW